MKIPLISVKGLSCYCFRKGEKFLLRFFHNAVASFLFATYIFSCCLQLFCQLNNKPEYLHTKDSKNLDEWSSYV